MLNEVMFMMEERRITEVSLTDVMETGRLKIRESVMSECSIIQSINEASDYIANWVGSKTPPDYALKTLSGENLPPGGEKKYFRSKTIYLRETNAPIGVMELYCGYPAPEALMLGWLFILPEYQKNGYAREVVDRICQEAKKSGFGKVRLGVHLKNWPALRFWLSMGFDKAVGIKGDEFYSESTYAVIILEKAL